MSGFAPKRGHRLRISRLGVTTRGNWQSCAAVTLARLLRVAIPSRRRSKFGDGLIAAELLNCNSFKWCDGFTVMRVEASPNPETGPSTHTPCAISATPHKQTFIYTTAMSTLAQKQSRLFDYLPVDLPIGKMSWKTAPCACPGDADSAPP
jgi:hypothetical protein